MQFDLNDLIGAIVAGLAAGFAAGFSVKVVIDRSRKNQVTQKGNIAGGDIVGGDKKGR
jgi:hypothetical protein